MKINNDIKWKHLPPYFLAFLSFIPTFSIKSGVIGSTLVFLDICVLPLLYPKVDIIYYITIPLLVFIHLWAIRLLFKNPYSVQLESVLYFGSLGTVGTLCYFILVLKMAYFNVGIKSLGFYIVFSVVYFITVFILVLYQIRKYAVINKSRKLKKKRKNMVVYGTLVVTVPAIGFIIGQYLMSQSQFLIDSSMLFVFSCLSIFMAYVGAKFIYKYIFMKVNIRLVNYQKPPKKMRREFRKKGIEIK